MAVDQGDVTGTAANTTVWVFQDSEKNAATYASVLNVGGTDQWSYLQRTFTAYGAVAQSNTSTASAALWSVPIYWHGLRQEANGLYLTGGSAVDSSTGRYLSQVANDANPYRFAGNNPTNFVPDPDGRTWVDNYLLDPSTQFVTGYADAWSFGYAGKWQRNLYGNELADQNQSGGFYYTGLIVGVAC